MPYWIFLVKQSHTIVLQPALLEPLFASCLKNEIGKGTIKCEYMALHLRRLEHSTPFQLWYFLCTFVGRTKHLCPTRFAYSWYFSFK